MVIRAQIREHVTDDLGEVEIRVDDTANDPSDAGQAARPPARRTENGAAVTSGIGAQLRCGAAGVTTTRLALYIAVTLIAALILIVSCD